jgi:hypothetical protein
VVDLYVGDRVDHTAVRAHGAAARPSPSVGEMAVVQLDAPIDDIAPVSIRTTGAAQGDHVRTVGFDDRHERMVRDHVRVTDERGLGFRVTEVACAVAMGSVALDESTAELVGVLLTGGPTCSALMDRDVYARADIALAPLREALGASRVARGAEKTKRGPIDMGAPCADGPACAAGACASYAGGEYCSRTCGPHDRCPPGFKCMQARASAAECPPGAPENTPENIMVCVRH